MGTILEDYYRSRAPEYDRFYQRPERQNDLARLRAWLTDHVRGRTILEVAAGTGYWTELAAAAAAAITATASSPAAATVAAIAVAHDRIAIVVQQSLGLQHRVSGLKGDRAGFRLTDDVRRARLNA